MTWKTYESHKVVQAKQITCVVHGVVFIDGEGCFRPTVPEMADKAKVGDYAVIYADGYQSISPRVAFQDGYTEIKE